MKASVFIAATLDGYIATPDGDIDFLNQHPSTNPDEDFGYHAFIDTINAIVMGRKSFEKVLSFDCDWPYMNIPVFVLSRSGITVPSALSEHVQVLNGNAANISKQLRERGFKHLYIDGGQTIQGFLAAGLIQELTLTRIPTLLGKGIPLFSDVPQAIQLMPIHTQQYDNGYVQTRYRVIDNTAL